jgi:hypothetical protein
MRPAPSAASTLAACFTLLKVRDNPAAADSAGWYKYPAGTVASEADAARLAADGVDIDA